VIPSKKHACISLALVHLEHSKAAVTTTHENLIQWNHDLRLSKGWYLIGIKMIWMHESRRHHNIIRPCNPSGDE
jgi:hypothetical protein